MPFFTGANHVGAKLEMMRSAELQLMSYSHRFGGRDPIDYDIQLIDTEIPSGCVPFKKQPKQNETLTMHGIRVSNVEGSDGDIQRTPTPLVVLHGYMNGALYFYRNIVGLSRFYDNVFSLDLMGWGLSSRPKFCLKDDSVESAEDFFVESLEAWRSKNNIQKMILSGHSMGGYLSVAYSERYPERVEQLILVSPVGVPEPAPEDYNEPKIKRKLSQRMLFAFFTMMFQRGCTPSSILRAMPERKSRSWIASYMKQRLPSITQEDERDALTDYLHTNCMLPGSGENVLNRVLDKRAFAKKPVLHRIPKLEVPHVSFLYGDQDWMDANGGVAVRNACNTRIANGMTAPSVDVYTVKDAGHLLFLENWEGFNSAMAVASGRKHFLPLYAPLPTKLSPSSIEKKWQQAKLIHEQSRYPRVEVQA